jgi:hypothetical protein
MLPRQDHSRNHRDHSLVQAGTVIDLQWPSGELFARVRPGSHAARRGPGVAGRASGPTDQEDAMDKKAKVPKKTKAAPAGKPKADTTKK